MEKMHDIYRKMHKSNKQFVIPIKKKKKKNIEFVS